MASRHPSCKDAEEDLEHLLIHCLSVWSLWEGLNSRISLGVSTVTQRFVVLERFSHKKENEEIFVGGSSLPFLGYMERKKLNFC